MKVDYKVKLFNYSRNKKGKGVHNPAPIKDFTKPKGLLLVPRTQCEALIFDRCGDNCPCLFKK